MEKKSGKSSYVPDRGDIVWIDLDPSRGSEIKKTRPALVVSPFSYNKKASLALLCPITSHKKGYPFEVEIPSKGDITGVILADQVKSLDWRVRNIRFEEKAPCSVVTEVIDKILVLLRIF